MINNSLNFTLLVFLFSIMPIQNFAAEPGVLVDTTLKEECKKYNFNDRENYCWIIISSVIQAQKPIMILLDDQSGGFNQYPICGPYVDWGIDENNINYFKKELIDKYIDWVDRKYKNQNGKPTFHNDSASSAILYMMFDSYRCDKRAKGQAHGRTPDKH